MRVHEAAKIFPMLPDEELRALASDIEEHGLRHAIITLDGAILDGRNRYKACEIAGVKPRLAEAGKLDSPTAYVISANLKRRHLSDIQKAAVAAECAPLFAKESKARQVEGGKKGGRSGGRGRPNRVVTEPVTRLSPTRDKAAKAVGAGRDSTQAMMRIRETAPDVFEAAKSGAIAKVSDAVALAMRPEPVRQDALRRVSSGAEPDVKTALRAQRREEAQTAIGQAAPLTGKYRVLYADPPWKYGDAGYGNGPAEFHYPTMTIAELCDLPVKDLATDEAVLFLWVTSPLLEDGFKVINAWGFVYKACFVWDKVKHNVGHYNSVRHEFLLICTRGSCTPDDRHLVDSVQSIERGEHSEKPERFRELIGQMYPLGGRIELFARRKVDGWEHWGNQV